MKTKTEVSTEIWNLLEEHPDETFQKWQIEFIQRPITGPQAGFAEAGKALPKYKDL